MIYASKIIPSSSIWQWDMVAAKPKPLPDMAAAKPKPLPDGSYWFTFNDGTPAQFGRRNSGSPTILLGCGTSRPLFRLATAQPLTSYDHLTSYAHFDPAAVLTGPFC